MQIVQCTAGPHEFPNSVIEELYRVQKIPGVKNIRVICPAITGKDRGRIVKYIGDKVNIKRSHSYDMDGLAELVRETIAFMKNPEEKYQVCYDTDVSNV